MPNICDIVAFLAAACVLLLLAFPRKFFVQEKTKEMTVDSDSWGTYSDCKDTVAPSKHAIKVMKSFGQSHSSITGSQTYSGGRGVGSG
jgi:hypothetical protein